MLFSFMSFAFKYLMVVATAHIFQLITDIPAFGIYLILFMSSLHETSIVSELECSK